MEAQKQDRMRISFIISIIISLALLGWWGVINAAMLFAIILPTQNFISTTQNPLSDAANLNFQGMPLLKFHFDKALSLINPNSFDALYNKGATLANLGKYNESIVYLDKALAVNPNSFDALYYKGAALDSLGKYNESIVYLDKALVVNPENVTAFNLEKSVFESLHKINIMNKGVNVIQPKN